MRSKSCLNCTKLFYKTPNISNQYWEEKRLYCSNRCKVLGKPGNRKGKKYPNEQGKNHHNWKGDAVGYGALHLWVVRYLGHARDGKCEECAGVNNLQWANVSGEYKRDLSDWKRLCLKCHFKKDGHGFRINVEPWNKGKHTGNYGNGFKKGQTAWNKKERKTILCKCGCGETRLNVDNHGKLREYKHGHNKKGLR